MFLLCLLSFQMKIFDKNKDGRLDLNDLARSVNSWMFLKLYSKCEKLKTYFTIKTIIGTHLVERALWTLGQKFSSSKLLIHITPLMQSLSSNAPQSGIALMYVCMSNKTGYVVLKFAFHFSHQHCCFHTVKSTKKE